MKVFLCRDLTKRWALSLERVHELVEYDPLFPKPYVILSPEHTCLYFEQDIIEYEKQHAELVQVYVRGRNLRSFFHNF
ncbi:hypothetical protein BACCIP111899_02424 [Bacillus rhizoplanae]|uniref:Uncharacterized protein n=1 Tax=Bacillus rhizoplanae TaxID=2880966 RepID=A0ABN7ZWA6_9BACI|nr:hypothetical protein [Bacillus rhizoplanae]CAG9613229.1 hypothetical protein BACCIP111899_02424 [Bacillus rhizoplanae]